MTIILMASGNRVAQEPQQGGSEWPLPCVGLVAIARTLGVNDWSCSTRRRMRNRPSVAPDRLDTCTPDEVQPAWSWINDRKPPGGCWREIPADRRHEGHGRRGGVVVFGSKAEVVEVDLT